MKKLQRSRATKTRISPKALLLIPLLLVVVFTVSYYRTKILRPNSVNLVSASLIYGPVEMTGSLYKETPAGIPGAYLLVNLSGDVIELEVADSIDNLVGQPVVVRGDLVPPDKISGNPILVVTSLIVRP